MQRHHLLQDCRDLGQPFALGITFPYPHGPYVPAKQFLDLYDQSTIPTPTEHWHDMENLPPELYNPQIYAGNHDAYSLSWSAFQQHIAHYRALCSQMDDAVGAILKHVDLDDTLLIFTSDHGDYQGRRGRLSKIPWTPFDSVVRVPLLIAGAGLPRGLTVEQPVALVDLAPTMLQATGTPIPEGLDGIPLQPYFADSSYAKDRLIHCYGVAHYHMVRWHDQKYFCLNDQGKGEMFFDLRTDPNEWKNLAADPSRQKDKEALRAKWQELIARPKPDLPLF